VRLFVTADLHHGIRREWLPLTARLAAWVLDRAEEGDVLALAGDLACGDLKGLAPCLATFASFPGPKALVPGNHDLWSSEDGLGARALYEGELPRIARAHGFAMLDQGPLRAPWPRPAGADGGGDEASVLGLAGGYGGYDFTLPDLAPLDAEERAEVEAAWRTGRFRHVFWNDYAFMKEPDGGPFDHAGFAAERALRLGEHLAALERDPAVRAVACITHTGAAVEQVRDHPAGRGRPLCGNLWFRGLSGSARIGEAIARSPKTRLHVCGHTHHERAFTDETGRRFINLGCDYDRKRWLWWDPDRDEVERSEWMGV
jgi:hypothetical protein